jgi:hypothetical protein
MRKVLDYKTYVINEGRYDRISGEAVDVLWKGIKMSRILHDMQALPEDALDKEGYMAADLGELSSPRVYFDLVLLIKRTAGMDSAFKVDAGAVNRRGHDPLIEVKLDIDPDEEPRIYSQINPVLQDILRHEIEHLLQGGPSKKPGKAMPVRKRRNYISKEAGNGHEYLMLRDEIPAMVHGMYRQAKTEKKPLDFIFDRYLNYLIADEYFDPVWRDKILAKWKAYAQKNLPAAQWMNEEEELEEDELDLDRFTYLGAFLGDESRKKLLASIIPIYDNTYADHVTLMYGDLRNWKSLGYELGEEVDIIVDGHLAKDGVQTVTVSGINRDGGIPHITISTKEGVKPVKSNDILKSDTPEDINPPIVLKAKIGFFTKNRERYYGPEA